MNIEQFQENEMLSVLVPEIEQFLENPVVIIYFLVPHYNIILWMPLIEFKKIP
jgi:hypothetical protein